MSDENPTEEMEFPPPIAPPPLRRQAGMIGLRTEQVGRPYRAALDWLTAQLNGVADTLSQTYARIHQMLELASTHIPDTISKTDHMSDVVLNIVQTKTDEILALDVDSRNSILVSFDLANTFKDEIMTAAELPE